VRYETTYFNCGDYLHEALSKEIGEINDVVGAVQWSPTFQFEDNAEIFEHQTGYNRALGHEFAVRGWEPQPLLRESPKLIGDFRKGLVFVEVQFGNSSTLYRDYYKFQYGLANGLLSLAVLIVPSSAKEFFPTRPRSVQNMAEYSLAHTCFTVLPLNVPTLLVGLLPEN
jgi:hypothetical protein